jgi:hypothetical protein
MSYAISLGLSFSTTVYFGDVDLKGVIGISIAFAGHRMFGLYSLRHIDRVPTVAIVKRIKATLPSVGTGVSLGDSSAFSAMMWLRRLRSSSGVM